MAASSADVDSSDREALVNDAGHEIGVAPRNEVHTWRTSFEFSVWATAQIQEPDPCLTEPLTGPMIMMGRHK
jgi:hypothetical protein